MCAARKKNTREQTAKSVETNDQYFHRMVDYMGSMDIFQGFDTEEKVSIIKSHRGAIRLYKKGEIVLGDNLEARWIGAIIRGSCHVYQTGDCDKERNLMMSLGKDDLVAAALLISKFKSYPFVTTAAVDTDVIFFEVDKISAHRGDGLGRRFYDNLMELVGRQLSALWRKLSLVSSYEIGDRVLGYLRWAEHETGSNVINIPFDRDGFAEYLGVNPSALSRAVTRLESKGLISHRKNKYTILKAK